MKFKDYVKVGGGVYIGFVITSFIGRVLSKAMIVTIVNYINDEQPRRRRTSYYRNYKMEES